MNLRLLSSFLLVAAVTLVLVLLAFVLMVLAFYSTDPQALRDMLMALSSMFLTWHGSSPPG